MKNKILNFILVGLLLISLVPVVLAVNDKGKVGRGDMEEGMFCIQVITPAMNPETKECKEFSTPCDVPKGWKKVGSCQGIEMKNEMMEKRKEMMEDQKDRIKAIKDEKPKIKENADDFVKRCKKQETSECKEKFNNLKENLGNHYVNVLEMLEKQLNIIKGSGIDVSKQVDSINALKTRVNAINEQTTKEELRKLHSDIKSLTKEIKEFHQKSKRMIALNKFGGVLNKAEKLEKKLDKILENAKRKSGDTSKLSSLIEEFKSYVAKAKEYQTEITRLTDGNMSNVTELMKKAHAELKEAHTVLTKIHQELKDKAIKSGGEA